MKENEFEIKFNKSFFEKDSILEAPNNISLKVIKPPLQGWKLVFMKIITLGLFKNRYVVTPIKEKSNLKKNNHSNK